MSSLILEGVGFVQNNATDRDANAPTSRGGGIMLEGEPVECDMKNARFSGNWAMNGGGIFADDISRISIVGAEFENNTALDEGGAVFMQVRSHNRNGHTVWKHPTGMSALYYCEAVGMYILQPQIVAFFRGS